MFHFTAGSVLGRYELLFPIAQGGMAEVWAARLHGTRGFTKLVAIKTIRRGVMDDARLEQMFLEEAHLASQIQHPNVVSTHELGEQDGTLFLAMEWADAEPLSTLLKETTDNGGIPLNVAVNIIAQACRGLHCAHELRDGDGQLLEVVHRDISPQNVLVTYAGIAKLVDFGIAKATQNASSMTEEGQVRGKLPYMSPEQVRGEALDRRTDIFAMGTLLYTLTTGQHPFKGSNPGETLANLCSSAPFLPPTRIDANYPPAVAAVVMKALAKVKGQRYASAEEMRLALDAAAPDARGIDTEVAKFIHSVSGPRGEQRRRQLRAAGEMLDRGVEDLAAQSQNPSSLSAVYLGQQGNHTMPSLPQHLLEADEALEEQPPLARKRSRPWAMAGSAVAFAALMTGAGIAVFDGAPAGGAPSAAASPRPPDIEVAPLPSAPIGAPTSIADPRASWPNVEKDPAGPDAQSEASDVNQPRARRVTRSASAAATRDLAQATREPQRTTPDPVRNGVAPDSAPVAASAPQASELPKTRPAPVKRNSWDPDNFGGRL